MIQRKLTLSEKLRNLEKEIAWVESEMKKDPKAAKKDKAFLLSLLGMRDQLRWMVEHQNPQSQSNRSAIDSADAR